MRKAARQSNAGFVLNPEYSGSDQHYHPHGSPRHLSGIRNQWSTITTQRQRHEPSDSLFFYTTDGSTPAIFPPGARQGQPSSTPRRSRLRQEPRSRRSLPGDRAPTRGLCFPPSAMFPAVSRRLQRLRAVTKTLAGAYLHASANTMVTGTALQFTAYGTYSDGSVSCLPDALGEPVTVWNTSNTRWPRPAAPAMSRPWLRER